LKSYAGQTETVTYFQLHPGNDAFISANFSSDIKKNNHKGPNKARKEGGGQQP
jgi:hypothetical protein